MVIPKQNILNLYDVILFKLNTHFLEKVFTFLVYSFQNCCFVSYYFKIQTI